MANSNTVSINRQALEEAYLPTLYHRATYLIRHLDATIPMPRTNATSAQLHPRLSSHFKTRDVASQLVTQDLSPKAPNFNIQRQCEKYKTKRCLLFGHHPLSSSSLSIDRLCQAVPQVLESAGLAGQTRRRHRHPTTHLVTPTVT